MSDLGTQSRCRTACTPLLPSSPTSSPGVSKIAPLSSVWGLAPGCLRFRRLPSSKSSHALGYSALAVSTTSAALAFPAAGRWTGHRPRRLWGSCRFPDSTPLGVMPSPRHVMPFEGFPSPSAAHSSHLKPAMLSCCFTKCSSPLVVGLLPPPLDLLTGCFHPASWQRVVRFPQPQGISPKMSPLHPLLSQLLPVPPMGFIICSVRQVVRIMADLSEERTTTSE